jgi:hypothetical protein
VNNGAHASSGSAYALVDYVSLVVKAGLHKWPPIPSPKCFSDLHALAKFSFYWLLIVIGRYHSQLRHFIVYAWCSPDDARDSFQNAGIALPADTMKLRLHNTDASKRDSHLTASMRPKRELSRLQYISISSYASIR